MLLKTSQDSLRTAFEYIVKLPFSKRILHKLSEAARGKCIAYFCLHRVLKDDQKNHPHYLNKTAITISQARLLISHINKLLPFISLKSSLELLTNEKPVVRSQAVLLIEVPYLETIQLLRPLLEEMKIPATIVINSESLHSGQMPWTDEIVYRLGHILEKEISVNFIDRTFPLLCASERLNAAHHLIENLCHTSPELLLYRLNQLRETLGEVAVFPVEERIATISQLENLPTPLFSFANAGRLRLPFYEMNKDEALEEVVQSQLELSSFFPSALCPVYIYPPASYRRKDKEVARLLMEHYQAAISRAHGVCRPGDNMFQLKCLPLAFGAKSFEQFELQGLSDAIDEFLLVTLAQEKGL